MLSLNSHHLNIMIVDFSNMTMLKKLLNSGNFLSQQIKDVKDHFRKYAKQISRKLLL
jgi:hypothetical protein